jgi:hypothetical protein
MGRLFSSPETFNVKVRADDRERLESLKRHPRETYGDVVHWLAAAEIERRGPVGGSGRGLPAGVTA